jgi:type II secretory pathway pseudopilin PulG
MAAGQEHCFACGQNVRSRPFRHKHRVNPFVIVGAGLTLVLVLGGLWLMRANAAKREAAQLAEEEALRVQDSARRAARQWLDALRVAERDAEAQAITAELDAIERRFESARVRVAAHPTPKQEIIIGSAEAEFDKLRQAVVVLASSPESEKQMLRDSINEGRRRIEALTGELGSPQ